jgi:hypothetical protein
VRQFCWSSCNPLHPVAGNDSFPVLLQYPPSTSRRHVLTLAHCSAPAAHIRSHLPLLPAAACLTWLPSHQVGRGTPRSPPWRACAPAGRTHGRSNAQNSILKAHVTPRISVMQHCLTCRRALPDSADTVMHLALLVVNSCMQTSLGAVSSTLAQLAEWPYDDTVNFAVIRSLTTGKLCLAIQLAVPLSCCQATAAGHCPSWVYMAEAQPDMPGWQDRMWVVQPHVSPVLPSEAESPAGHERRGISR